MHTFFSAFYKLVCFLLMSTWTVAQGYVVLSGKIIDKATQKPLPYAHIGIMEKGMGTLANEQGEFYYRFPKIAAEEQVVVTYMGYKNLAKKGSEFVSGDKTLVLELETAQPVIVDSAYVKSFNARGWVDAALSKVSTNYTETPIVLTGFYQETLQQNNDYVDIREAVLRVEKDPRPKIEVREKFQDAERTAISEHEPPKNTGRVRVSQRGRHRDPQPGKRLARVPVGQRTSRLPLPAG